VAELKVREVLQQSLRRLAAHPKLGHRRPNLTSNDVRSWSVHPYLITYSEGGEHLRFFVFFTGQGICQACWSMKTLAEEVRRYPLLPPGPRATIFYPPPEKTGGPLPHKSVGAAAHACYFYVLTL